MEVQVKQRLRRILMFRNASVPRTNKAIKVLFMAHQQYKKNVQKFITDLRRKHRHVLVPFHLPTNTVLEQAPNTLDKVLWNHKKKVTDCGRSWRPQQCSCQDFLRKHPNAQQHEGHVVTGIETLSMPKSCSVLKNIGASNAFFTTKSDIFRQTDKHYKHGSSTISSLWTTTFSLTWTSSSEQSGHSTQQKSTITQD